jgi:hypothetical protein
MIKTMSEVNLAEMEIKIRSLVLNQCQVSGLTVKAVTDASDIFVVSIVLTDDETSKQYDPFMTPKQIAIDWISQHGD